MNGCFIFCVCVVANFAKIIIMLIPTEKPTRYDRIFIDVRLIAPTEPTFAFESIGQ